MLKFWDNVKEKYFEDLIVFGKVVRFNDFGVFVELEFGVDGLVYIFKIFYNRIEYFLEVLKVG